MPRRPRFRAAALGVAALALSVPSLAPRAAPLPTPGSPSQVAAGVAAAPKIDQLPADLVPALADVANDDTARYFPATRKGCSKTNQCVYGVAGATPTVVLFGDSHAAMWLPPLNWIAKQLGFRIVLLWSPGCPDADVTVWNPDTHSPDLQCNAYRARMLTAIEKLHPSLVLLSNRTSDVKGANGKLTTNAAWQAGLEATLAALLASHLDVAVIGDITAMTNQLPQCLAVYPKHVQRCSSPDPNPAMHQHVKQEEAAAAAKHVDYVNPQPWVCTTTCSPVVDVYAVYCDSEHLSATYAAWLAQDLQDALKALLPSGG